MQILIDIAKHHYENIKSIDSVSLGRIPYKGIIMYSINAIKNGVVQEHRKGHWVESDYGNMITQHRRCRYERGKGMTREEREAAIDIIQSILNKYEEDECLVTEITIGDEDIKAFKMAIKVLEQEPRRGHWIFVGEENEEETRNGNFRYICSECGYSDIHAKSTEVPYCWHCGVDMREVEE